MTFNDPAISTEPPTAHVSTFWQRGWVQRVLPMASSLALHLGVLGVGLATYRAIVHHQRFLLSEPYDPVCGSWNDPSSDRFPTPQPKDLPGKELQFGEIPDSGGDVQNIQFVQHAGGFGEGDVAESSLLIGPSKTGTKFGGFPSGQNASSESIGIGPVGRATAPNMTIFISQTPAKSLAFVCDASGSMTQNFGALKREIVRYIDVLKPVQAFNVIFFQESAAASIDGRSLLMAKPDNKRRAYTFLDGVSPRGQTDPMPALELAFRQHPALIYLLTDGDFADNAGVLRLIRERNADHRSKINTIAFVSRGAGYEKVLQTIAKENDGVFRYVSEDDLGR